MTWYFNNEGAADGPHDEEAIQALIKQRRIGERTLVWHPQAGDWQAASVLAPGWWIPLTKTAASPARVPEPATAKQGPETRSLLPKAPRAQEQPRNVGSFLKKLFGLGGGKN